MSFHVLQRRMLVLALPLLLAGCASLAPQSAPQAPSGSLPVARVYQDNIDLSGRLSVRYQGERKEEALHGSFTWAQTPTQTTVTLLSPLGQTIAIINVTAEGATLTQGGQPMRAASNVDTLTAETLGWPLPVAGLRDWLQGFGLDTNGQRFVATPEAPNITTHDGWRIHYANWQDHASSNRPKRIDLAHSTEQTGDIFIRIVIDSWQAH